MKQTKTNTTHTNHTIKKINNWAKYNKALENRGNFIVLFNAAYLNNSIPERTGKAGHPKEYTDAVILFIAQIREFMHLPIRQAIGVAKSISSMAHLDLRVPSRTTVSRRLGLLKIPTGLERTKFSSPIIFLPDSTGLKISGEGEWKVKKHGAGTRREWVKLHLGIDYTTQMIVSSATSSPNAHDGKYLKRLFRKAKQTCGRGKGRKVIGQTIADGAYGDHELYEYIEGCGSSLLVPPPKNAIPHYDIDGNARTGRITDSPGYKIRNNYLYDIKKLGRDEWKRRSGYHKRSIAETAMYRFKQAFGSGLKSKLKKNQIAEINIRIYLLNTFTSYGLPQYTA